MKTIFCLCSLAFVINGACLSQTLNVDPIDFAEMKNYERIRDSIRDKSTTFNFADTSNIAKFQSLVSKYKGDRFFVFGNTSISSTDELSSSIRATQQFNGTVRIKPQKLLKENLHPNFGFDINLGINLLNIKPSGVRKDSIDFNELMFQEAGNAGGYAALIFHLASKVNGNLVHRFSSELSGSIRQSKVIDTYNISSTGDTLSQNDPINFTILNFNFTLFRYNFLYQPDEKTTVDFRMSAYLNLFNIPNEDVTNFNRIFPSDDKLFSESTRSLIYSFGTKISCSVNNLLIFSDIRYNLNPANIKDSNPFKGTVFNIGLGYNLKILSK